MYIEIQFHTFAYVHTCVREALWLPDFGGCPKDGWVAVEELISSYFIGETRLFTLYIYIHMYIHICIYICVCIASMVAKINFLNSNADC